VSDVSQGPGWWQASDGKWYSPEQTPGVASPPQVPSVSGAAEPLTSSAVPTPGPGIPSAPPGYGPPPSGPGYGSPPTGPPPAPGYPMVGDPAYGYQQGGGPYGYAPQPRTNGLAIASFVCSLLFWLYGIGAILGLVFGFIARSQIKRSGGSQQGGGLALAGIIISFVAIAIGIVVTIVVIVVVHHCDQTGNCTGTG
jgi:Domain of unknown function (DUF4190)